MKKNKLYIEVPSEVSRTMILEGRTLEKTLLDNDFEIDKEEIQFEGQESTRGIVTAVLITAGTWVALELGKKVFDKLTDPLLDRMLKPIVKRLEKTKKEEERIIVKIFLVESSNIEGVKKIVPLELPDDNPGLELRNDLYIRVQKEVTSEE